MKKKLISIVLTLSLLLGLGSGMTLPADAEMMSIPATDGVELFDIYELEFDKTNPDPNSQAAVDVSDIEGTVTIAPSVFFGYGYVYEPIDVTKGDDFVVQFTLNNQNWNNESWAAHASVGEAFNMDQTFNFFKNVNFTRTSKKSADDPEVKEDVYTATNLNAGHYVLVYEYDEATEKYNVTVFQGANRLGAVSGLDISVFNLFLVGSQAQNSFTFSEISVQKVAAGSGKGKCGDNVYCTLDDAGHLTISGTGAMWDYSTTYRDYKYVTTAPWGTNITSVTIGSGVTTIGDYAFYDCTKLTSITIPDSVTTIGGRAFYDCYKLTSVTFGENSQLTTIGGSAFYYCSKLTSIIIPSSVTTIGGWAFCYCNKLTSVTIPDSVTTIGEYAFYDCNNLTVICPAGSQAATFAKASGLSVVLLESDGWCGEGVRWHYDGVGTLTISGEGSMWNWDPFSDAPWADPSLFRTIVIEPGVTSIGAYAFSGAYHLQSVSIPEGVITVGDCAFAGCTSLKNIVLPASAKAVSNTAFYNCRVTPLFALDSGWCGDNVTYSLDNFGTLTISGTGDMWNWDEYSGAPWYDIYAIYEVVIQPGVTSIGRYAFTGCRNLTSVTIPEGVTYIGKYAFSGCKRLPQVTLPQSLEILGKYAFYNCLLLDCVVVPAKVSEINRGTFEGCVFLKNIDLPDTITRIGASAFECCGSLKAIDIPQTVETIGSYAFYCCSQLSLVSLPAGLSEIQKGAFECCPSLARIALPGGIRVIGDSAFENCTSLVDIGISPDGRDIGSYAFYHTPWYEQYAASQPNGVLYLGTTAYRIKGERPAVVTLRAGTKRIAASLFEKTAVQTVYLPNSLESIGDYAFFRCDSLTSITIPDGVTTIGNDAFCYCYKLTSVTFGENSQLTTIGDSAFYYCTSLTSITIPDGVTTIGERVFYDCYKLTSVTFGENSQLTTIGYETFYRCDSLTSITIPDSVTTIGNDAFCYCDKLTSVTFGENSQLTNIGYETFYGCDSLTSITIPDSVITIGWRAFGWCNRLTIYCYRNSEAYRYAQSNGIRRVLLQPAASDMFDILVNDGKATLMKYNGASKQVMIPETVNGYPVVKLGNNLFSGQSDITSITIPDGVTTIGNYAFYDCTSLTSITIPDSVTTIGERAFYDCYKLTLVTFGENSQLTTIGDRAFYECDKLTSITIPDSVTTIGDYAVPANTTIYCYRGSEAHRFAFMNDNHYEIIETPVALLFVQQRPNKTVYRIGERLDTTGLILKAVAADESFAFVTADYTAFGFDSSTTGTKTVSVTYGGQTARFTVLVTDEPAMTLTTVPQTGSLARGSTFTVAVNLSNNTGTAALQGSLNYDHKVFTLLSATNGDVFGYYSAGTRYLWDATENVTKNGTVVTFTFRVNDDAALGEYPIQFICNGCSDKTGEDVPVETVWSSVEVIPMTYGDANGDMVIDIKDVVLIRQYIVNLDVETGVSSVSVFPGADANGDGEVDIKDVVLIRQYIVNLDVETGESSVILGPQAA